ncbi:MAG: histidinol-phosphate transaminase [Desulfovibrionaceae bacterium]
MASTDAATPAAQRPGPATLRPEVLDFTPYVAGLSIEEITQKYGLSQVIKMASNENPLGVSPLVQRAIRDHAALAFRYPRSGNPRLLAALASRLGVAPSRLVVGNGSDEIIDLLIRVRATPGTHNVLTFKPCFSMYTLQSRLCGVELRQVPLRPDYSFPYDDFVAAADENTAIAFITTPDNPSGFTPPVADIEALARALPQDCLLVVDEAYMDFALPQEAYSLASRLDDFPNVVIVRTFSKMYGLAGMRLGYGIMPEWLADYMWRVRPPFSVNILAEEAGIAALADTDFLRATLETVAAGRELLGRELAALGCEVAPSQANFLLFTLPQGARLNARAVFERLLQRGVIIRPLASYNLPDSLRVTVGNAEENMIFLKAMREVLRHG